MTEAQRLDLRVWRRDPMRFTFAVRGVDASGSGPALVVRLYPDAPGAPQIALGPTTTEGAEGVRCVDVYEEDGLPVTLFEAVADKETIAALPEPSEAGSDLSLAYDMQWTLPPDPLGFTQLEQTFLYGKFIVRGSVND